MPVKKSYNLDLPEIPPQNVRIDAYVEEVKSKINWVEEQRNKGLRTTDYTITNFADTKKDRMWKMKVDGELIDSILITADGQREPVHIDIIDGLKGKESFLVGEGKVSKESKYVKEYQVNNDISASVLRQVVKFAYLGKCELADEEAGTVIALTKTASKYELDSLLHFCMNSLMEQCSAQIAFFAYELASEKKMDKGVQLFFQKYIQDHFQELFQNQKEDLLRLSFPLLSTILTWNKLNVQSEKTVWEVIHDWVANNTSARLPYLNSLLTRCLRLGRLEKSFLKSSVLGSALYQKQSLSTQVLGRAAVNAVLATALHNPVLVMKDGFGLLYSKALSSFRPRHTRQLLVVAGGWVDGKTSTLIELYDHQCDLWVSSSLRLTQALSYFGFELIGTVLYVFGGSNGREITRSLMARDLAQKDGQWVSKASMHERRCYVSSTLLDGLIYAIGGFNQTERVRKCESYDPSTDSWTAIAQLNYARSDASCAVHNGRIYVAGGINDNNIEHSVEVYSRESNTWMLVKAMATPRTSFSIASFAGRIWAMGGNDGQGRLATCESYDSDADVWQEEQSMINGRSTFKAITFMCELYAVGGYNGSSPISNVEKYVPGKGWTEVRHLRHDRSGLALLAIKNEFAHFKV